MRALVLLLLLWLPQALAAQSPFDFRILDTLLRDAVSPLTPGLSLTLVVDGKVVYRQAFGSYEPDRPVQIASASKWYAAAVLMGVVDEGKLRLEDRASQFIPNWPADKSSVTLRHLLSHTSGLVADHPCLFDPGMTLPACVDTIGREPLLFPPGTKFSYGNAAFQVAARMAERATGKSWSNLFAEKLARPLELACTRMDGIGSLQNPLVAGGVVSCAADYAKFLKIFLNEGSYQGRRLLSPAAVAEMTRDQTMGVEILRSVYEDYRDLDPGLPKLRYGLGVWRERVESPSGRLLDASSQGAMGFSPWIDIDRHLAGVLSVQSSQDLIMPLYLELKELVRRIVPPYHQRTVAVTNGASYRLGAVAPGEVISVFGPGIGPDEDAKLQMEAPDKVGTALKGFRVLIDGKAAPLLFAGWSQISALAPFSLDGKDRVTLAIERSGKTGPSTTLLVAPAAPGVFTAGSSGNGNGAIVNEDGTLNSAAAPARRGSIILVYATGGGMTDPPGEDGKVQAGLSSLRLRPTVRIGGQPAVVLYAGGAPGLVSGVLQLNVRISENTPAGPAVPLTLSVGEALSQAGVTVAINW